jgi:branched-chain amino acid transport system ATP-binding protein
MLRQSQPQLPFHRASHCASPCSAAAAAHFAVLVDAIIRAAMTSDVMTTPLIDVAGLSKRFGGLAALSNVSLKVTAGQIAGLIGPNGAGKSTFFNVLTGIFPADAGEITFAGQSLKGLAPHVRVKLGMVRTFQKVHPFTGMSVLESVMVGCHTRSRAGVLAAMLKPPWVGREEKQIRERARAALTEVGLVGQENTPADALPLGRQRLLQLACALVTEPRVLLLDEPASGLNSAETAAFAELLLAIRAQGKTLVLVEHDMSLVMRVCDALTVLNFGRQLACGTPDEIRRNPEVIKAYLGAEHA